jgi:hypothetical protein
MPQSVQSQLARQENSLEFLKQEVKDIKDEMRSMRNAVRGMLLSLVGTIIAAVIVGSLVAR